MFLFIYVFIINTTTTISKFKLVNLLLRIYLLFIYITNLLTRSRSILISLYYCYIVHLLYF